jgi:hypothetical protein
MKMAVFLILHCIGLKKLTDVSEVLNLFVIRKQQPQHGCLLAYLR